MKLAKVFIILVLLLTTTLVYTQTTNITESDSINVSILAKYNSEKKGYIWPVAASLIPGILIHGSGHFAAGAKETGYYLLLLEFVSFGFMATMEYDKPANILGSIGTCLFLGTYIYDVAATPFVVNRYNKNLKQKYKLSLSPIYKPESNQVGIGFAVNF